MVLGIILALIIGIPLSIAAVVYLVVPCCKGLVWLVAHIFRFITGEIGDVLRLVGALLTSVVLIPITVGNIIVGRWSSAGHYGRAIQTEAKAMGAAVYRLVIGHPARLLCLSALTEGIERRLPAAVAAAPGADAPPRRVGQFEGYTIVGSLPGGGSGGKLYIADPTPEKLAALAKSGVADVGQVVIKCFSLRDGSSLPQIVRENRALPAAKRLGLILEHDLSEERFYYIMRYVPGDSLGLVTQRLHAESGPEGLAPKQLRDAIEYGADLVRTLCHYHAGGLWHKDVKPDNIIVAGDQAHLVDFGLITPLRSSMTLTTHGTEYFRDPEMVRLALRGVKVHEVDGAKFDIYAAGAVLYSVIENSFPAHGGLSQISKRCPEALRWIVRRAMTDYDKRYPTAAAMLADLEAVSAASDPFALKPAMLPSFREADEPAAPARAHEWEAAAPAAVAAGLGALTPSIPGAAASLPPPPLAPRAAAAPGAPRLRVTSWWTGRYELDGVDEPARVHAAGSPRPRVPGATAAEQLARARDRARSAQARAHARMQRYTPQKFAPINAGVRFAALVFLVLVGLVVYLASGQTARRGLNIVQQHADGSSRTIRIGPGGISINNSLVDAPAEPAEITDHFGLPLVIDPAIRITHHEPRGQVMVLRDPITFEKTFRPTIDRQMDGLREAGFTLRGNHSAAGDPSDPEVAAETELIAELRSELGVAPMLGDEARAIIQAWLGRYPDFKGVIWIGRGDDGAAKAWIIGPEHPDAKALDAASGVFSGAESSPAEPRTAAKRDRARRHAARER